MRGFALSLYGLGDLFFLISAAISIFSNQFLGWAWRPDWIAFTFLPALAFSIFATFLQLREAGFLAALLLGYCLSICLLLLTVYFHAFSGKSILFGSLHLGCIAVFAAWESYKISISH